MKDKYAREQIKRLDDEITAILAANVKQATMIVRLAEFIQKLIHEEST